jgi:hypothetical protein
MKRKRHSGEEIIQKLCAIGEEFPAGKRVAEVVQGQQLSLLTYQTWKNVYGGMMTDDLQRFKELQKENARLMQDYFQSLFGSSLRLLNLHSFLPDATNQRLARADRTAMPPR